MGCTLFQFIIIGIFIITGTLNTVTLKMQNCLESVNSVRMLQKFHHPFIQTLFMFLGMFFCLFEYYILYYCYKRSGDGSEDRQKLTKGSRKFNKLVFVLPAMCDLLGTGLSYLGLIMTYAASYQMIKGSVIIFVGLMSMIFLKRNINVRQWIGMITVFAGLIVVCVADFLLDYSLSPLSTKSVVLGDILILVAQIFSALQSVIEEKYAQEKNIPALQAVGLQGLFGFVAMSILLIPMYFIYVGTPFSSNPNLTIEDAIDAAYQYYNNGMIVLASFCAVITTAFYNFAGISITKEFSATTRMVLDTARTIFIWMFSLLLFEQQFDYTQVIGYIILLAGLCIYNDIQFWMIPCFLCDLHGKKRGMMAVNQQKNILA